MNKSDFGVQSEDDLDFYDLRDLLILAFWISTGINLEEWDSPRERLLYYIREALKL